jgi:hypothetical protein
LGGKVSDEDIVVNVLSEYRIQKPEFGRREGILDTDF